jgi:RNA-directed DNA polymerase
VESFLAQRGLQLSPGKTVITHINAGFNFLGQNVRRYANGLVLTTPSKANVKTFLDGVRKLFKKYRAANAYWLIKQLNPKIRGWSNYHRHTASKRCFNEVDNHIFEAFWAWAKRRHPHKSGPWIANKYVGRVGLRNRCIGQVKDEAGNTLTNWLGLAAATPIKRHAKIKTDANPYDSQWEVYFEERLGLKMAATLHGRRKLAYLWKEQAGRCPICEQPITQVTGWHNHHIIWRSRGGSDAAENRVLVHPECHRQLHAQGFSVSKPRLRETFSKA